MDLCLNVGHFRPATQQECTDAVIKALEVGMPFEIPVRLSVSEESGGEDEDDGEGEGDDNDGYWSHGTSIGRAHYHFGWDFVKTGELAAAHKPCTITAVESESVSVSEESGGEDEDDGEGESDDNDGYWSHGIRS
jgi:hypothetical protein